MSRRSDAVRNHERVLSAAISVYRARGPAFEVREVAERAGVGVGTVYRHFADRERLIDAIAEPFFEEVYAILRRARDESPAEERLADFVRAYAAAVARSGVRGHCSWDSAASRPLRLELRASLDAFLEDGRRSGALRVDLTREDAASLLRTVALLVDATVTAPGVWTRQVELMLDGLRAGAPPPLRAPVVDPAEWDALVGAPSGPAAEG
jgi:AcrR family transcriptional regulator